jgi:HD-like signal output (HDOD) protein
MTSMGGIERFFLSSTNLPAMPGTARLAVASFDDASVDLPALAAVAVSDPALAARIVQSVLPAQKGSSVARVAEAASRLGLEGLRERILVASIAPALPRVAPLPHVPFWTHALTTAAIARALAPAIGVDGDSAFLAGLLQRSGELLLARALPELVTRIEAELKAPGDRGRLEELAIGYTHAHLSAELGRRWKLPQRIIDGLERSADPLGSLPFSPLAALLDLSATLADAVTMGMEPASAAVAARGPLLARLQADEHWLRARVAGAATPAEGVDALVS